MTEKYRTKTGEYVSNTISNEELIKLGERYDWMRKYVGQLKGAVIRDVSINIDVEQGNIAFPCLKIELMNGDVHECEIISVYNPDTPGFIAGLPFQSDDN